MPRSRSLAAVTLLLAGLARAHAAPSFPQPPSLDPRDFALMAWDEVRPDPAILQDMREAGLNVAGFCAPSDVARVRAAGLACFLMDPRLSHYDYKHPPSDADIRADVAAFARTAIDDTVLGVLLHDEPQSDEMESLGRVTRELRQVVPGKLPLVNLFPYREFTNDWYSSYEEYMRRLMDEVRPPFVSFDNYALTHAGMGDEFFSNLALVRKAAEDHHVPFWACIQAVAHFGYRVPTDDTLRLQVYSALAHGARGIEYFTYFTPERGNYRQAALDPFGHKTDTWHALRRINSEVRALAPTLLRLHSTGVFHYPDVPRHGTALAGSPLLRSVTMVKDEDEYVPPAVAARFLVGEFADDAGRTYLMVVNKDLAYSFKFELEFRRPVAAIWRVNPYTGREEALEGEQNWLPPGGGVLLRVQ